VAPAVAVWTRRRPWWTGRSSRAGRAGCCSGADAPAQPPAGAGGRGAPNPLGEACTDFLTPEQYAAKNGALGVVTIASFQQLATMANPAGLAAAAEAAAVDAVAQTVPHSR